MASKLRSLRRNIAKVEKLGFIVPTYLKQIKKESTAAKYSQRKIMELSKFKEIYQGKERIVSGERGREVILRQRAEKAAETRRRRKVFDFRKDKRRPIQYFTRENQAYMLDSRITSYFNQFANRTLGELFSEIYQGAKEQSGDELAFLYSLLDVQQEVIELLQTYVIYKYPEQTAEQMNDAGTAWLKFITNNMPTEEQRMAMGDAEDQG